MEKKVVIQGKDLSIGYRTGKKEKIVHKHLNFQLHSGELTCLLGANGAGKSTLLRTLSASQPSLSGELRMLDKPVSEYTEKERSRTIGVVLTDKTFTGGLSVYELVALGRQPHTGLSSIRNSPLNEGWEADNVRNKVDLPAPLAPNKQVNSPL